MNGLFYLDFGQITKIALMILTPSYITAERQEVRSGLNLPLTTPIRGVISFLSRQLISLSPGPDYTSSDEAVGFELNPRNLRKSEVVQGISS